MPKAPVTIYDALATKLKQNVVPPGLKCKVVAHDTDYEIPGGTNFDATTVEQCCTVRPASPDLLSQHYVPCSYNVISLHLWTRSGTHFRSTNGLVRNVRDLGGLMLAFRLPRSMPNVTVIQRVSLERSHVPVWCLVLAAAISLAQT